MIMQDYKNHKPQDTTFSEMAKASLAFVVFCLIGILTLLVWSY